MFIKSRDKEVNIKRQSGKNAGCLFLMTFQIW